MMVNQQSLHITPYGDKLFMELSSLQAAPVGKAHGMCVKLIYVYIV